MAPMFEIYFLIGSDKTASEEELMELSSEMGKFNDVVQISSDELNFSFSTQVRPFRFYLIFEKLTFFQAHLMALNLQQSCSNIASVTHMIDNYKLNIRRLFKEYLTPGVPEDKFICLDQLLPSSTPDYFTLSKFIWYSNWPSRYHSLPERCASPTFTISSKVTLKFLVRNFVRRF